MIDFKKAVLRSTILCALLTVSAFEADAVELKMVSGAVGIAVQNFPNLVKPWEEATGNTVTLVPMPASTSDQFGQYRLWLAAQNPDIDLYQTDIIWAPQLANHFVDMTEAAKDIIPKHFPQIIQSQTVEGKLVALPIFTDAPALYYRKDLLEKYGLPVPKTWAEMTETAKKVQDGERAAGKKDLWGFVWQGNAYEGLTCDGLEWIKSFGGGQIVEPDGTISVNNDKAVAALQMAKSWVGTISPEGVLAYQEEEARGLWQTGNAVFMRNWPYAFQLGNGADSAVKGLFDVTTLPAGEGGGSAATLGGWNVAVSKYSTKQDAAKSLALYLAGPEGQKLRALTEGALPTIVSLYDDKEIAEKQTLIPRWKEVFVNAVPRPSAPTRGSYNEVSSKFWSATHDVLSGRKEAPIALEDLEADLTDLKGNGWK